MKVHARSQRMPKFSECGRHSVALTDKVSRVDCQHCLRKIAKRPPASRWSGIARRLKRTR